MVMTGPGLKAGAFVGQSSLVRCHRHVRAAVRERLELHGLLPRDREAGLVLAAGTGHGGTRLLQPVRMAEGGGASGGGPECQLRWAEEAAVDEEDEVDEERSQQRKKQPQPMKRLPQATCMHLPLPTRGGVQSWKVGAGELRPELHRHRRLAGGDGGGGLGELRSPRWLSKPSGVYVVHVRGVRGAWAMRLCHLMSAARCRVSWGWRGRAHAHARASTTNHVATAA